MANFRTIFNFIDTIIMELFLVIATITSIMPIDSRTLYARIGAFQSTKIDNLNFTVQHISFMHNKMSIKFFIILFFLMWVLLKIYFDIS